MTCASVARELLRTGEEPVRGAARPMMYTVRASHATEEAEPCEPGDGEPTVDEAVVHHHVGDAEQRHPDPDPADRGAEHPVQETADDDEHDRDGRMSHAEHVVRLEAAVTWQVMTPMNGEENAVPDPAMEEASPELHRRHHERREGDRDEDLGHEGLRS